MTPRSSGKLIVVVALLVVVLVPLVSLLPMSLSSIFVQVNASGSTPSGNYFDHVVIILMENNGYCNIITSCGGSGPYETSLAHSFSLAGTCSSDSSCSIGGYTAITHPSEPNYVALFSSSTNGVTNDGQCCYQINSPNLVDRLQSFGLTWKAYAEDATNSGTCSFTPPRNGDHFPFKDFSDMDTSARCSDFLTTTSSGDPEFLSALNANSGWANFYWLTPNDNNNGHDTSATYGDNYLSNLVPKILSSSMFKSSRSALFIVYDEGNSNYPNDYIYASWSGSVVKQGYVGSGSYSHYSFLKTLEQNWGFSSITSNDANARAMSEFFTPMVTSSSSSTSSTSSSAKSSTTTSSATSLSSSTTTAQSTRTTTTTISSSSSSSSPLLTVSPTSGVAGETIKFQASHLADNARYSFNLDNSRKQFIIEIKSFTTNSAGSYSGTFTVPKLYPGGYYLSVATPGSENSKTVARIPFEIKSRSQDTRREFTVPTNILMQLPAFQIIIISTLIAGVLLIGLQNFLFDSSRLALGNVTQTLKIIWRRLVASLNEISRVFSFEKIG
jgi:hypothetical protein